MPPSQVHYQDIKVRPEAIQLVVAAFGLFPSIGQKYLAKHGIAPLAPSQPNSYIQLSSWLATFQEILSDIGPNALFRIGQNITSNPHLPSNPNDVETLLHHLDIGFHMSHFKGGKPMFDAVTKQCVEGIGHFLVKRRGSERAAVVTCDTPYPCPLEHGILSGVTALVEPRASVIHQGASTCRMKGSGHCAYLVRW